MLLLIPAETYRATDFIVAANRMGLELVVGSDGALPLGDRPAVRLVPDDVEGSADRLASSAGRFDAVVGVDTTMLVPAAAVAARLGLPHNPIRSVEAAMDKAEQRRVWAAARVPQPEFRVVPAEAPDDAVILAAAEVGFPCVVKAVSLSGSQGVLRADDQTAAAAAAETIRRVLMDAGRPETEPLLVEEYVPGPEVSIDGLLTDDSFTVTAVFDKPDTPDGPTFEETLLVTPSRLPVPALDALVDTAREAARALGLRYGPIHAELRMDNRVGEIAPTMLELAARSIGGLCSRTLRFLDGVSLEEKVLANALGRPVSTPEVARPSGVLMLYPERPGTLRAVEGRSEAAAVPGITGLSITIAVGRRVRSLPEGDRYLGFIFAEGDTHEAVAAALHEARDRLRVVID